MLNQAAKYLFCIFVYVVHVENEEYDKICFFVVAFLRLFVFL